MKKVRTYIRPSSLASYFGVGFNTPEEQLKFDMGYEEPTFDEDAKDRMRLGSVLENSVLDYFEQKLGIIIGDRNEKLLDLYDGKVFGKVDGTTVFNGLNTIVECKVSNARTRFTDSLVYKFQTQAYLLDENYEQILLLGLQNGVPIYKTYTRNEEMIQDIKEMADFITSVQLGFESFDNYPTHLIDKYDTTSKIILENVDDEMINNFETLAKLKKECSDIMKQIKPLEAIIKSKYKEGKWENDNVKISISKTKRAGSYDMDKLSIEHPDIDYEKYRKPSTEYSTLRVTSKKK